MPDQDPWIILWEIKQNVAKHRKSIQPADPDPYQDWMGSFLTNTTSPSSPVV